METNITLGRIAGIRIGLNWSVLIIAWLICWGLATDGFPTEQPGNSDTAYWVAAAITSVLFFSSLLAHELTHSVVARRRGVMVEEITLWMLGGVAKLSSEAERAGDELRIAIVGPLCSFVLALVFGSIAVALGVAGAPDLAIAVPAWLATINVVLAVFNLLPAFPMDGGRVLRALLWGHWHDKLRATRAAAGAGRGFGWAMVTFGVFIFMAGGGISGLWFGFIGAFLIFASTAEAAQVEQGALLGSVTVAEIMTADPITAPASITVQELIDHWLLRHHVSAFPVMDSLDRVVGLVTLERIRTVEPARRDTVTVAEIAWPVEQVPRPIPSMPVRDLLAEIVSAPSRRALVFQGNRLVGIVSMTDVSRTMQLREVSRR